MDPDVVSAVDALVGRGVLDPRASVPLRRAASGALISIRAELSALLWIGVALVTTGVGILVKQSFDRIGPLTIAIVIGAAAATCLAWAFRRAPGPSLVFESVLLLGALLAAADIAFIEVQFTPLGPHWTWHLLIVASGYAALAFRFDSKSLFSLALTSFAAWRGVSISGVATPWGHAIDDDRLFVEALICGVLFLALGKLLESTRIRPQFEPVAAWLGWILIVAALVMRLPQDDGRLLAATALVGAGALLAWFAWDERSVGRYALGIGAGAVGIGAWAVHGIDALGLGLNASLLAIVLLATAVIVLMVLASRALRART